MSDSQTWADWFNSLAWAAIWSKQEERADLKAQIDFMARQRLSGIPFDDATLAYGKPMVPPRTTEQMLADLDKARGEA